MVTNKLFSSRYKKISFPIITYHCWEEPQINSLPSSHQQPTLPVRTKTAIRGTDCRFGMCLLQDNAHYSLTPHNAACLFLYPSTLMIINTSYPFRIMLIGSFVSLHAADTSPVFFSSLITIVLGIFAYSRLISRLPSSVRYRRYVLKNSLSMITISGVPLRVTKTGSPQS